MIYLDHNATTPLAPSVADAMRAALATGWGNPSSSHAIGRHAKELLELGREQVAALLDCATADLAFTSGATEADNLAVFSAAATAGERRAFVCPTIEHPAIIEACRRLEASGWDGRWVNPNAAGAMEIVELARHVDEDVAFVAMMLANNETGVIQPVAEAARVAHAAGAQLICDAVQAAGKVEFSVESLGADYVVLTAHKMYGPKGVGVLWVRPGLELVAQQIGGSQERGRRGGTENVLGVVALGAACELARSEGAQVHAGVRKLRDRFEGAVATRVGDVVVNGAGSERLANTSNLLFGGVEGDGVALALDLEGFAVSAGSACHSGAAHPSPVLSAMGLATQDALASVRITFGRSSTEAEVDALLDALPGVIERLREAAVA